MAIKEFIKNNLTPILTSLFLSAATAFWATFVSPNLVFAEDIDVVTDSIEKNSMSTDDQHIIWDFLMWDKNNPQNKDLIKYLFVGWWYSQHNIDFDTNSCLL